MNKPCAYCGKEDTPRHKGHVIPKSLYPSTTPTTIQRPTVPECEACRRLWTDAETQFRNVLVIAGEPNAAVYERWDTVRRSFQKPSGRRWLLDTFEAMVPVELDSGSGHMVYPCKDESVNLVLRRIVRGLCAYHGLGGPVPDENVWVGYAPPNLSSELKDESLFLTLGDEFLTYGFSVMEDSLVHSAWLIRIYERSDFMGVISHADNAKEVFGPIFNPCRPKEIPG